MAKKIRWLLKGALYGAILLGTALLGAKVAVYFLNAPNCDLSDIDFSYAVNEEAHMPVVEVFFVTSRRLISAEEVKFADEAGDKLYFGIAQVRIPAKLRIGDIQVPEIPRNAVDEEHATISLLTLLSEDEFHEQLASRFIKGEARAVNLLVHGVNHTFDSSVRQAGTLTFDLNMAHPMVLFSWPTGPGVLPGIYKKDRAEVGNAAIGLQHFLEEFQQHVHPRKINVLAHSLGCKVVCETFDLLVKEEKWNDAETELANVVLAAPDVDKDDFDRTFVKEVARLAGRVTIYVASNDGILVLSSYLNGKPRAGVRDQKNFEIEELVASNATDQPHIQIIDATFVNNTLTEHSYYYQSRPAFSDLYNLLRNDLPAEQRHVLRHEKASKANYWIIPP